MGCVVVKDRFGDCHAVEIHGEANPDAIRDSAGYLAHNVILAEPQEMVAVGLCAHRDPGAARLCDGKPYADGGIEWLYRIRADELPDID